MDKTNFDKQIFLIVTGFSCNNNCVMCSVKPKSKDYPVRTTEAIVKDLIRGRKENYEKVEFTGGEPTIRKDILYLIEKAQILGYKEIAISTNGRLLSYKDFCDKLVKKGLNRVTFTLHAHKKQLHESISRTPNSFGQTLAGIKNALNCKNLLVSVNTVVFKSNYQHIFQIGKFIHSLGVPRWNVLDLIPDGYAKEKYKFLYVKINELSEALSSLKPLLNNFQSITFFDFPLCIFSSDMLNNEKAGFITAQGRLEITKQTGYKPKRFLIGPNGDFPIDIHKERINVCQDCIFSKECAGIWKDYLDLFGDEEVKKLATKNACIIEKPRQDTKSRSISEKEIHTYVQINTTCNQKCVFCNRPPETNEKQIFKLEDVKKRIEKISKNPKVKKVVFTGGEPLLYPHLSEVIRWAKKYSFVTEIQTNGTLLSVDKLSELKKAGLDIINLAFHSHKKDISNKLRRVDFGFNEIEENLKLLNKMGFETHIIHVINSLNYKDLPEFIDYVNDMNLQAFRLNLSLIVPEGWAWENKWIVPRMSDIKPYLIKAMKRCKKYNIQFDISEIVPLCIVEGFEEYAVSTLFKISNLEIIDDYLTGERSLDFANPSSHYAAKAPQCQKCTLNDLCAGFYPRLKELYGVDDFIPRKDDPSLVLKKISPELKITEMFKDKKIEASSHQNQREPKNINSENKMMDMFKDKKIEASSHQNQREPKILYISMDPKCNEDCVFCITKGENKDNFGEMSKDEAKETIKKFMDFGVGEKRIVFTGGEPTLRNDLPEVIEYSQQFDNLFSISIITNGVRLSDEKYLNMLINVDKKDKVGFCVSLHSHKEKISELLTNSKGTFKKTISGIENIIKKGKRISIYQVITSKNYEDLLGFAKFLNKKYPEIKDITFAYPFPQGNALLNDWIYAKLSLLKPHLIKTLKFLENKKYVVGIAACGQFPLCVIPEFEEKVLEPLWRSEEDVSGVVGKTAFHEFDMASKEWIDQYKGKNKECEKCILNKYCQGFWKKYTDLFGFDGIELVNKDNFKGNKIKSSLKNEKQFQGVVVKIIKDKMNLIILTDYTDNYLKKLIEFIKNNKIFCVILCEDNEHNKDNVLHP